jgi:hypothetical protein
MLPEYESALYAFGCFDWSGSAQEIAGDVSSQSTGDARTAVKGRRLWAGKLQYVIRKLRTADRWYRATVPVSPRLQRMLKNYVHRAATDDPGATGERKARYSGHHDFRWTYYRERNLSRLSIPMDVDFTLIAQSTGSTARPRFDVFDEPRFGVLLRVGMAVPARKCSPSPWIYHIEHGSGSGGRRKGEESVERITAKGIPILDNDDVLQWGAQMRRLTRR